MGRRSVDLSEHTPLTCTLSLASQHIGDCIGRGAFGTVHRADHWRTGEVVAVKRISTKDLKPSALQLILAETKLLAQLDHPNIVALKGSKRHADTLAIVLEHCENGSLAQTLKRFGKLPEKLASVYLLQLLQALVYLHRRGILHRDVKAANILTTYDGTVKLADFGAAARLSTSDPPPTDMAGSPYWMSPEMIQQEPLSTATDIWSVGCLTVELLTGHPPYYELDPMPALFHIVQDEGGPPVARDDSISELARDFLSKCFAKRPERRATARRLMLHGWLVGAREELEHKGQSNSVVGRRRSSRYSQARSSATASRKRSLPDQQTASYGRGSRDQRPAQDDGVPGSRPVAGKRARVASRQRQEVQ